MKKLVLLLAALVMTIAACSPGGQVAATVEGTDITTRQVEENIDSPDSVITKELFARFLGFEIQWNILQLAADEEWKFAFSEDEITEEADRIYGENSEGQSREEFLSSRSLTEAFLLKVAEQSLLESAIREEFLNEASEPTTAEIDAEMVTARAGLTNVCVSHILVPTEEDAQDVVSRLESGEVFADLASELSTDTVSAANGGELPCGPAGQYVEPFRDAAVVAPIGEVYQELVESNFGFHVIIVTERTDPAEEELPTEQEIAEALKASVVSEDVAGWFAEKIETAAVIIVEQYGTWQTSPEPAVIPPAT